MAAERLEDVRLVRRRLRKHRMERHDEGLRQLFGQREDVFAVTPTEDAVLVLEQHNFDVPAAEDARGPDVVAARSLRYRRHDARTLWARGIVDDHDLRDGLDLVQPNQRRTNVGGERPDSARARWVCGDDGCAHSSGLAAVSKSFEHWCTPIDRSPRGNRTETVLRCGRR